MPKGVKRTPGEDKRKKTAPENLSKARAEMREIIRKGKKKRNKVYIYDSGSDSEEDAVSEPSSPEVKEEAPKFDYNALNEELQRLKADREQQAQTVKELRDMMEKLAKSPKPEPKEPEPAPKSDMRKALAQRMLLKF